MEQKTQRVGTIVEDALPLRDMVYHKIRQAILVGDMQPGERLMEIHLAERLDVSRTPVREAIHKLEQEGLVIMTPRKGAEVAQITKQGLRDVLEVRRGLDAMSIELACERITEEGKKELNLARIAFEEAIKGGDIRELARTDVAFHEIIVNATGNQRLIEVVTQMAEQMYRYRFEYLKDTSSYEKLVEEHRRMCKYIERGDSKQAAAVAREHIDNQEKSIMQQLDPGSAFGFGGEL